MSTQRETWSHLLHDTWRTPDGTRCEVVVVDDEPDVVIRYLPEGDAVFEWSDRDRLPVDTIEPHKLRRDRT